MRYNVSPMKNKNFYNFLMNKLCIAKILEDHLSIPTDNGVVVAHWSLWMHSRNMAKSAIHKLLTEVLYGMEKLIYIRFIDKHWIKNILLNTYLSAMHSMTKFAVLEGESRDDSSDQQQQAAMFVSDILEKLALSSCSAHQSPLKITRSLLILYNEGLS